MITYTLIGLAVAVAAIFAAPLKAKVWTAFACIAAGAVGCGAAAVAVLASPAGTVVPLWQTAAAPLFGADSGSMDGLSALMVCIIAVASLASVLYSRGYLEHHLAEKSSAHISLHYAALTVMVFAMFGVVLSDGGYSFLFYWELMTIASFLLILFDAERPEVLRAALTYLVMMHIGFVLLLIGFVSLYEMTGGATFDRLAGCFASGRRVWPLFLLFLAGFGMKAGLFPMHVWLPEAHPAAPSHVSALMSGVMIKTGVYGILRLAAATGWSAGMLHTGGLILLGAGIVTGLWGVLLAAAQNDVKRLLAYSSIENVGIIFIGLGVALLGAAADNRAVAFCGLCGALLHLVNHSFFKSLLFFGAGNLLAKVHTTSFDALGGVAKQMPVTALLMFVATTAICALPPLNGFVSEFLIYSGLFNGIADGSLTLIAAVGLIGLAAIGGLVVLAFTKLYGTAFLGSPRSHEVAEAREADNWSLAAMALPLAGILAVGLFPQAAVRVIIRATDFFFAPGESVGALPATGVLTAVGRTVWLLILVVGLLWWWKRLALRDRKVRSGAVWGCGFTAPNVRMQYTGESFSEGLQTIITPLTQNTGDGSAVAKKEIFPTVHTFSVRHKDKIDRLFAAWWVELLRQINKRAMRLRTGKINHYVLFALAFLVLIFLLSLLNLI